MKLKFLWIGATRDPHFLQLEERYMRRIRRFFPVEKESIPEARKIDRHQRKAALDREGERIEKKLPSGTRLVVLDAAGCPMSSDDLAGFLQNLMNRGSGDVTFLVGGHQGIPGKILNRAHDTLSLGPLTLPHELARVVLLEQIFRAASILNGHPYHK